MISKETQLKQVESATSMSFMSANDPSFFKKVFFTIMGDGGKYCCAIRGSKRRLLPNPHLQQHKISNSNAIRLIIHGLNLIKELHYVGARLDQPLQNYLQFIEQEGQEQFQDIKFVKMSNQEFNQHPSNIFGQCQEAEINSLTKEQVQLFKQFFLILVNKLKSNQRLQWIEPKIIVFINFLQECLQLKKEITLSSLELVSLSQQIQQCLKKQNEKKNKDDAITKQFQGKQRKENDQKQYQYDMSKNTIDTCQDSQISCCGQSYPFDCVLRIESTFIIDGKKRIVPGVGSLIDSNLVVTGSHLIYFNFEELGGRTKAQEMFVFFRERKIKVKIFQYSQDFHSKNRKIRRENAYAMLFLQQKVQLKKYLSFKTDFEGKSKIMIPTIAPYSRQINLQVLNEEMQITNSTIIKHKIRTTQGNSGSPILIKQQQSYFIIGVNSVGSYVNSPFDKLFNKQKDFLYSKGIKITDTVARKLKEFEKELIRQQRTSPAFIQLTPQIEQEKTTIQLKSQLQATKELLEQNIITNQVLVKDNKAKDLQLSQKNVLIQMTTIYLQQKIKNEQQLSQKLQATIEKCQRTEDKLFDNRLTMAELQLQVYNLQDYLNILLNIHPHSAWMNDHSTTYNFSRSRVSNQSYQMVQMVQRATQTEPYIHFESQESQIVFQQQLQSFSQRQEIQSFFQRQELSQSLLSNLSISHEQIESNQDKKL